MPQMRRKFGYCGLKIYSKYMLTFAAICPHPPLLIPSIGGKDVSKVSQTTFALNALSSDLLKAGVDTVVVISPHGPMFMDFMSVNMASELQGDFRNFGNDTAMNFVNDTDLAIYIKELADSNGLPVQTVDEELDHGAMVPLYFLAKGNEFDLVHISFSYLDYARHFSFGEIIYEAIENSDKKVAVIASGDLSHRLVADAPAGYSPKGKVFDELLIKYLEANKVSDILSMDSDLIDEAGECGLRSFIILLGILSNTKYSFEKISYEGPFGVGYLVGNFRLQL